MNSFVIDVSGQVFYIFALLFLLFLLCLSYFFTTILQKVPLLFTYFFCIKEQESLPLEHDVSVTVSEKERVPIRTRQDLFPSYRATWRQVTFPLLCCIRSSRICSESCRNRRDSPFCCLEARARTPRWATKCYRLKGGKRTWLDQDSNSGPCFNVLRCKQSAN